MTKAAHRATNCDFCSAFRIFWPETCHARRAALADGAGKRLSGSGWARRFQARSAVTWLWTQPSRRFFPTVRLSPEIAPHRKVRCRSMFSAALHTEMKGDLCRSQCPSTGFAEKQTTYEVQEAKLQK